MFKKLQKFYYFHLANPVVLAGDGHGFRYVFRRFWLEIETASGNFKMRIMADEHPYAYLLAGVQQGHPENLFGFAETLYYLNATLTRDQGLVNDVQKALRKYENRLSKTELEPDDEEAQAIEEVKAVQEYVDASPKERRKMERDINGRFKKSLKKAEEA